MQTAFRFLAAFATPDERRGRTLTVLFSRYGAVRCLRPGHACMFLLLVRLQPTVLTARHGGPGSAAQIPSLPSGPELKPARATGSVLPPRHVLLDFSTISCGKCSLCSGLGPQCLPVSAAVKRYEVATIAHKNRRFDSAAHRCAAGRAVSLYAAPAAVPAGASPHCSLCTARIRACTACIRACTACIRVDGLHWSSHRCSQPVMHSM